MGVARKKVAVCACVVASVVVGLLLLDHMQSNSVLIEKRPVTFGTPMRHDYLSWRKENMNKLPSQRRGFVGPVACSSMSLLVTGLPRSGTTIMGAVAGALERVAMVHEPGNPSNKNGHLCAGGFVPARNGFPFEQQFTDFDEEPDLIQPSILYFNSLFDTCCTPSQSQLVLKDPTIVNNARWMYERYGTKVVVMIRHPAAIINSWKSLGWGKAGMHVLTKRYMNWMKEMLLPAWEQYHSDDDWMFIRHEDFCRDPMGVTLAVHEFMGEEGWLSSGDLKTIENVVRDYTDASNKDARHGYYVLKLNAEKQMTNWKQELTPEWIEEIRRDTELVWRMFYDDSDW